MKKIRELVKRYPYILFVFGFFLAFVMFGTVLFINSNQVKQRKLEIEKKETKKKAENKEKKEKEQAKKSLQEENSKNSSPNEILPPSSSIDEQQSNTQNATESYQNRSEDQVVQFFSEQENLVNTKNENDPTLRGKISDGFRTMYAFLFQGERIKGYTFSELSSSAKIKVMKIALSIDHKIDSYFPNYKNSIKSSFGNLKSKVIVLYLDTTAKICNNNESLCQSAREDFNTMKKSFGFTFSLIKNLITSGSDALKEWYYSK